MTTPATTPTPTASTEYVRNRIKCLVHRWMSIWDLNDGDASPLIDLLSPEGFAFHTTTKPEPITTLEDLRAWYAAFPTRVKIDNHVVESIEIEPLPSGRYRVLTHIRCPGIAITGEPFLVTSVHDWEVADYGGLFPRICTFDAKLTVHPTPQA